jgi:hypothetical protein
MYGISGINPPMMYEPPIVAAPAAVAMDDVPRLGASDGYGGSSLR